MNRAQKAAWFIVINFTVAIILSLTAYLILPKFGTLRASWAVGFLGLCGFSCFVPILFKKETGQVECDERDVAINRKAALGGFFSAFLFVSLACLLPFFIMGPNATIRVSRLPLIIWIAVILNFYIHSIMILVMYGKGGQCNE